MKERDLCTKIVKMVRAVGGAAWKIPDDRLGVSTPKPFDIFGATSYGLPLYLEAKLVKTKTVTLAPSRIAFHQAASLEMMSKLLPDALVGYAVGHQPRPGARVEVYFFNLDKKIVGKLETLLTNCKDNDTI